MSLEKLRTDLAARLLFKAQIAKQRADTAWTAYESRRGKRRLAAYNKADRAYRDALAALNAPQIGGANG